MQAAQSAIPERNLPADLYGRFDIRMTEDGGKQYTLPHTLSETVMTFITRPRVVGAILLVAIIVPVLFPERDADAPLACFWLYATLTFFLAHGASALAVMAGLLVTGIRKVTRIAIRADGLILNDASFYPAEHIWVVGYGVTSNEGKPDEAFQPHIAIQVGMNRITLAEGVEVEAGKLFMRLFSDDTRQYWARHN